MTSCSPELLKPLTNSLWCCGRRTAARPGGCWTTSRSPSPCANPRSFLHSCLPLIRIVRKCMQTACAPASHSIFRVVLLRSHCVSHPAPLAPHSVPNPVNMLELRCFKTCCGHRSTGSRARRIAQPSCSGSSPPTWRHTTRCALMFHDHALQVIRPSARGKSTVTPNGTARDDAPPDAPCQKQERKPRRPSLPVIPCSNARLDNMG